MMRSFIALTLALVTVPAIGHADIIGAYVAGKADYVHGTGTAFEGLDADMGYGVEAGVELLGIELWGEALFMGEEQYLITANLGIGLEIGGDISITAGAYTGPMFFKFAPGESAGLEIPADVRSVLDSDAVPVTAAEVEAQYNAEFAEQEQAANEMAFGWNLVRGRILIEYSLLPFVTLGVGGHAAYHYTFSGSDAVAGFRNEAIDAIADEYKLDDLDSSIRPQLKEAAGAKAIDEEELSGINYNVGAFLKVSI